MENTDDDHSNDNVNDDLNSNTDVSDYINEINVKEEITEETSTPDLPAIRPKRATKPAERLTYVSQVENTENVMSKENNNIYLNPKLIMLK